MHDSLVAVLSSGSCGNSTLVSSPETSIMIDAGLSCRELERRLGLFGVEPSEINAVLLTHEHTDHNRGAQRFCKVHDVPLYGTEGTLALTPSDGIEGNVFTHRQSFEIGDIAVRPFPVKHLAADPVAFTFAVRGKKVSYASDLGCITDRVVREMKGADLLMVEANYDDAMLRTGNYPGFLKRAILSDHGHLSNDAAGNLCANAASADLREVVLLHLSRDNNRMEIAEEAVCRKLGRPTPTVKVTPTEHGIHSEPFRL